MENNSTPQKPKKYTDIEKRTKEVYVEQHKNFSLDNTIFKRHLAVASDPATYGLPRDFFQGKSVLDAGCGNSGYMQVAMNSLGVEKMTCLDLGTDWIAPLQAVLDGNGLDSGRLSYVEGSTTGLPFEDESFDFVVSNGVIMHLESLDDAALAIRELARVTKKKGYLWIYSGVNKPGIVDRYIVPALRRAYVEDDEFREFIDTIDHREISNELVDVFARAQAFDNAITDSFVKTLGGLFTLDSSTFTQNMLQVPMQWGPQLDFDWVRTELEAAGFDKVTRIKERYWVRNDYRRFLAPLHYFREGKLARLLYGGGHVRVLAKK